MTLCSVCGMDRETVRLFELVADLCAYHRVGSARVLVAGPARFVLVIDGGRELSLLERTLRHCSPAWMVWDVVPEHEITTFAGVTASGGTPWSDGSSDPRDDIQTLLRADAGGAS